MPPPKIPAPEFSPTGRYLIDVATRKDNPVFHDTYNYSIDCRIEEIATRNMSRFNSKSWAISRGYNQCTYCKVEKMTNPYSLGRLKEFDERSRNYPIRSLIPTTLAPRSYTWSCGIQLDQGNIGSCVGHSWAAELAARPVVKTGITNALALGIYREAQKLDEWPGEAYEGTSILAGAKVIQGRGFLTEYRWAFGLADLIMAVGYKGPAVIGIPWLSDMFDPDADGTVHATGPLAGEHALLCNAVSISKQRFRFHNSWSANWGLNGDCFISFSDLETLLHQGGEACIPVKRL